MTNQQASTTSPSFRTAIIVDDNPYAREVLRIALEAQHFTVTDFADPVLAVQELNVHTYNLLLLDLQMPNLDGRQVLRLIRPLELHKEMIIIVQTAHPHMDTTEIQNFADHIMYKPLNINAFIDFVNRILPPSNPPATTPQRSA